MSGNPFVGGGISPSSSATAQMGGTHSNGTNNLGTGGFPFLPPSSASNNMMLYIGLGVVVALLWKKRK